MWVEVSGKLLRGSLFLEFEMRGQLAESLRAVQLVPIAGTGYHHATAVRFAVEAWSYETERAEWKNSQDVKAAYATANIVGAERVVFNNKGIATV